MITARDYQKNLIVRARKALRKHRSACVVLPTGGGKTIIFALMSKGCFERKKSVLILVHRIELLEQTCEKLRLCGLPHGVIARGVPLTNDYVQVGMVNTVWNLIKKGKLTTPPNLIVTDECHHVPASTYHNIMEWMPESTKSLGFTATPERLDGKGLGDYYETIIIGSTMSDLISDKWLVPYTLYRPELGVSLDPLKVRFGDYIPKEMADLLNDPKIIGDCVKHYQRYCPNAAAVAFCINIEHALHVAKRFKEAGIPAAHVDGTMDKEERKNRLKEFRDGKLQVLTSCNLISEGFDLPRIEAAILMRPTKSLAMYLQQVGRALRTDKERGKKEAIILDHVGNSHEHLAPDLDRQWSLEGRQKRDKDDDDEEIRLKTCMNCWAAYRGNKCPKCETSFKAAREGSTREIEEIEGELVKAETEGRKYVDLTPDEWKMLKQARTPEEFAVVVKELSLDHGWAKKEISRRCRSLSDFRKVEAALGYKEKWAEHRYRARHGEKGLEHALKLEAENERKNRQRIS